MLSHSTQLYFMDKGLSIKEVFLLNILKTLSQPISLNQILLKFPILALKQRQYCQILEKFEDANILVKVKGYNGYYFIFPFLVVAKNRIYKPFRLCEKSHEQILGICGKSHNPPLYKYYNNKSYVNNLHNVVDNRVNVFNNSFKSKKEVELHKEIKAIFKKEFPTKNTFIKDDLPPNFNIHALIKRIKESPFLLEKDFTSLNWCVKNYQAIISGYYKPFEYKQNQPTATSLPDKGLNERTYTKEFLDSLFDPMDDIEI